MNILGQIEEYSVYDIHDKYMMVNHIDMNRSTVTEKLTNKECYIVLVFYIMKFPILALSLSPKLFLEHSMLMAI